MDAREHQPFADQLRSYRQAANFSQKELAARARLNPRSVSDLERGVATAPHRSTVARLADALGLSPPERAALERAAGRPPGSRKPVRAAADPLLETKLAIPPARSDLVLRPRLIEALDAGLRGPLTLLSAPAGSGKTTLVSAWHASPQGRETPLAWVSLDSADNDAGRFWHYVLTALDRAVPGVSASALGLLRAPHTPSLEEVLTALINALASTGEDVVLALDDLHLIEAGAIHEALAFLLGHLPPQLHVLIATRADPPLPLSRLRARGQMTELRAADLSFTAPEVAALLESTIRLSLPMDDIAALQARTEGWITGLQLAALSLRDRSLDDAVAFIGAFTGSHRHLLDYLADEVLMRQPAETRAFLLRTAILDRLCASLCAAVVGDDDVRSSQTALEELERRNLFVVALDGERRWYRYHHLFGDFLRARLEQEDPGQVSTLHRRAGAWYEHQGWASEAVGHALAAGDHDHAAELVEKVGRQMWSRGEVVTLLTWVRAMPDAVARRRPRFFLDQAIALLMLGRSDGVDRLIAAAEEAAGGAGRDPAAVADLQQRYLLGYAAGVRGWQARVTGDLAGAIALAQRALAFLEQDTGLRSLPASVLGDAQLGAGDLAAASEVFAAAAEFGRSGGHVFGMLYALSRLARVQRTQGRLRAADATLRQARHWAEERVAEPVPAMGLILVELGALHYERDHLDAAERDLRQGIALAERTGEVETILAGYTALARTCWARGDHDGALALAEKAEQLAQSAGVLAGVSAAAWAASRALARGAPDGPDQWMQGRSERVSEQNSLARTLDRLTTARQRAADGCHDEALRLLEELRAEAEATGRTGHLIEILALEALLLRARGTRARAVETLWRALVLAEPEGYVRTFADEGPAMATLLAEALDSRQRSAPPAPGPVSPHYLRRLLAATRHPRPPERLAEELSDREREVLVLLAAGLSNPAIARELYVGVNTVKTHLRSLYGKLDVHDRERAVLRARELGLI